MSAWLYLFAWATTLVDQLAGLRVAGSWAAGAIVLFLLLEAPRQRPAIRTVAVALVAVGLVAIVVSPDPWSALVAGWRRGAAYAAFFLALGTLREAAASSDLVRRCGEQLADQPPGRRYLAMTAGAHLFAMILSYGAIDLLGAMVARAGTGTTERTRRLLMAANRGFATMNCWSPLNIMTVVVSAAVPAAELRPMLPTAFAVAVLMLLAGWLVDRLEAGPPSPGTFAGSLERWTIHLGIVALVGLVMLLAEAVALAAEVSLATGVTATVPLVGLLWVAIQAAGRPGALRHVMARAGDFRAALPGFRGEATVLAASGFLGMAIGAALPTGGLATLVPLPSGVVLPMLVPVVLLATSLLGLNPIAVVAVVGAAVPDPASLGVPPAVLAFACMLGWGVAVGMTPFSASAIATARWTGADPWQVTARWNRGFTVVALTLAWLAIAAAQAGWLPGFTTS